MIKWKIEIIYTKIIPASFLNITVILLNSRGNVIKNILKKVGCFLVNRIRIPILKLYDYLLVSIQWELDDQTALQFQEDLLNKIHETSANGVVIDLTSIDFIDSFIAKVLGDVIGMSKLMGAKVVLTGIQPAVAITLVELGISLNDVLTALDLEKGLEKLQQELED